MTKKRTWKLKQKWVGLILSIICFVSVIAYAVADATPTLKVSVTDPVIAAQDGKDAIIDRSGNGTKKTVTYHLSFENDKDFNSLSFFINYDPTKLKLVNYTQNTKNPAPVETVIDEREGLLVWSIMYISSSINTSLDIGDITFEVLDTASGTTEISLTNIEANKITDGGQTLTPITVNGVNERVFIRVPVIEKSIALANSSLYLELYHSNEAYLVVDYSPKDTTDDKNFTYTVIEGTDVVKVENGIVTGLKVGDAKIKVTAFGKEFEASVTVKENLRDVKITNKEITNNTLEINKNNISGPITLTTTTTPVVTTDTITYHWTSSDPSVATVNNGVVTVLKNGTTTITVSADSKETDMTFKDHVTLNITSPATQVNITETDFTLNKNETKKLNAITTPSDTTDQISWSSSNTSVATVDNNGLVTAIDRGEATITVTVGNHSDTVKVTVNVPVTDIILDETDTITLLPNEMKKVLASVIPANANDQTIHWSILDSNIAKVDQSGLITALTSGETTLTIQSGAVTKTRKIKVLKEVEGLNINFPSQTLKKGETLDLIATPTTGAEESGVITWTSSNPSAATVDQNGKVVAIAPNDGSASTTTITATWTSNLNASHKEVATSTITVIDPITKIELNKDKLELTGKGSQESLTATLTPYITSSNKTITWSSSDTSVITVSNNGVVTAVGKGTATITATTSNGLTAKTDVVVTIPTTKVTIETEKEITMDINTTKNLVAKVEPSDTTDTLRWSSSDSNVVSVNEFGIITAKNSGTATIKAQSGSKEDQITIHVVVPVTSFQLVSSNSINVLKGTTSTIVTKINPDNATDQKITWTSSNEEIASVDEFGIVTGKKEGNVTITGSLSNGMKVNVDVKVEIIPITAMELVNDKLEIKRKEEKQLELLIKPEDTTEKDQIIWTSSDEEIAVVDEFGIITGKKEGNVTITGKYKDLEVTASVEVTEIHLESIALENALKELNVGDTTKLNITLNPTDVTDDLVYSYSSSDTTIATIDETGIITALNPGAVTITIDVNGMKLTHEMTIRKINNPQTGISSVAGYGIISILSLMGISYLFYRKAKLK